MKRFRASSMKLTSVAGGEDGVPQLVRRNAPQRLVEGERVEEDGPRDVRGVGRESGVVLGVELLSERSRVDARDVVPDCGHVGALPQPRDDLLANGVVPGIDVVHMNRGRVVWLFFPQVRDRPREEPEHPAHALEVPQRRGLPGQGLEDLRVQRVARAEDLYGFRACGVTR